MPPLQIFVSHSSRDADTADCLIRLLRAALSLNTNEIRCTSVDGYRLPGGADTDTQIRAEVNNTPVFLGIISAESLRSLYVVFELGARWGTGKPFIPLLAPGTHASMLVSPLSGIAALRLDSKSQVQQLLSQLGEQLGRTVESLVAERALHDFMNIMETRQSETIALTLQQSKRHESNGVIEEPGRLTVPIGLASHYFSTDAEQDACVIDDCVVLVCASELSAFGRLLSIIEQVARAKRPLLLVARGIAGEALATLITNNQRGVIQVCVVTTSEAADPRRIERLIATRTGATIFDDEAWNSVTTATLEKLGTALRVEAMNSMTTIKTSQGQ